MGSGFPIKVRQVNHATERKSTRRNPTRSKSEDAARPLASSLGVSDLRESDRFCELEIYLVSNDGPRQGEFPAPLTAQRILTVPPQSCKLIPVLLLNVILYRRKFKPYKYAVVALVSAGIALFMYNGSKSGGGGKGQDRGSVVGLSLLGVK
jgi:hypothetical protein